MKKHITEILIEQGYKVYRRSSIYPRQNANAFHQNKRLLERNDLIFIEGDKDSDKSSFYFPRTDNYDFSSMMVGGLHHYYVKDLDFENAIIFGLSEYGKPPTLVHPRPNIKVKRKVDIFGLKDQIREENQSYDDSMNICLSKECHYDILEKIKDKDFVYRYDLTKKTP